MDFGSITDILADPGAFGEPVEELDIEELDVGEIDTETAFDPNLAVLHEGAEYDHADIMGAAEKITQTEIPEPADEKERDIDPELQPNDMMILLAAEIVRSRFSGHHLDSMNSFYKYGLTQIIEDVFTVEASFKNQRNKTEEDLSIETISFIVKFSNINLSKPKFIRYETGNAVQMYPQIAREQNRTYLATLTVDINITAVAILRNGAKKERTAGLKDMRIASIPCMVGSELCHTHNCSPDTLRAINEDPHDIGAYFIIKGGEWIIGNRENLTNNTFHVYKNAYNNEIARGSYLSKPGDAYENSYQIILRYLQSGAITVGITLGKKLEIQIPFYVIFRALGMTRDRDIMDHIVYGVDNTDHVTTMLKDILDGAFDAYDTMFEPIKNNTTPAEIINFLALKFIEVANTNAAKRDDNVIKYMNGRVMMIIDKYIFPHIGTKTEHRVKKLRFMGHLINKMLQVTLGIAEQTDRDSYSNKRLDPAGKTMAKTFKTAFNQTIAQNIKHHMERIFNSTQFSMVSLQDALKSAIITDSLEQALIKSITSGDKTISTGQMEITNRVSSQPLYRKNDVNVISTARNIDTASTSSAKQTERADIMRRVHPSGTGYVCPSQSHETGEIAGLSKQMACTASITEANSSQVLKYKLLSDKHIIPLDRIASPAAISYEQLAKVFVNGDWIGCCKHAHELVALYRKYRRHEIIHYATSIVWELSLREVYFWTDSGRFIRPLIIVHNNLRAYRAAEIAGKPIKFKQWINLTRKHIFKIACGQLSIEDLRKERIIEHITPEEQINAYLATDITALRENVNNVLHQYTHCEIPQAVMGIIALAAPYPNCSNAFRTTLYTNHRRQSAGWFALNYPHRIDKHTALQHYVERPLVSSLTDTMATPGGTNAMVAMMLYGGEAQEDSIKASRSAIDCGMFNLSYFIYYKSELEKREIFGNPNPARTMETKRNAISAYVRDNFAVVGSEVKQNYVLATKVAKLDDGGEFTFTDRSLLYLADEPARVESIIHARTEDDIQMVKIKLRMDRPAGIGDKLGSRTGNKGIIAITVPRADMPFIIDPNRPETSMAAGSVGITPDLIINTHSLPTRMAVNQIIEQSAALLSAKTGKYSDSTAFRNVDAQGIVEDLKKQGFENGTYRHMSNGRSGEFFNVPINIGINSYQRLQKFAINEQYAMQTGPTQALTRQPLEGKSRGGGLRIGEMEKDALTGQGAMYALGSKFYDDSDGITMPICRTCGKRALVNEKINLYKCRTCEDRADIVMVPTSWVTNVTLHEYSAIGVSMTLETEKSVYPE